MGLFITSAGSSIKGWHETLWAEVSTVLLCEVKFTETWHVPNNFSCCNSSASDAVLQELALHSQASWLTVFLMTQYHFCYEILKSERSGEKHFSSEHVTVHDQWFSDYASVHMRKWGVSVSVTTCTSPDWWGMADQLFWMGLCQLLPIPSTMGEWARVVTSAGTLVVCLCWNWPEPGEAVGWLVRTRWQLMIKWQWRS